MYLFMSLKLQKHFYYENERCENGNTCLLTHASTCASPQAGVTRLKSYILARARLASASKTRLVDEIRDRTSIRGYSIGTRVLVNFALRIHRGVNWHSL